MLALALVAAPLVGISSPAHALTVSTININKPIEVVFSKDNTLAFVLTSYNTMGTYYSDIYKITLATGAKTALLTSASSISDIDVGDDGSGNKWLYYSDKEEGGQILKRMNFSGVRDMSFLPGVYSSGSGPFYASLSSFVISDNGMKASGVIGGSGGWIYTFDLNGSGSSSQFASSLVDQYRNPLLSPDGNILIVSKYDKFVEVDLIAKTFDPIDLDPTSADSITSYVWGSETQLVVFAGSKSYFWRHGYDATLLKDVGYSIWDATAQGITPSRTYLATGSYGVKQLMLYNDNAVTNIDIGTGKNITGVAVSSDGAYLAALDSNSSTNTVSIVTLFTPRTIFFDATTADPVPYGSTKQLHATVSAGSNEGTITYSSGSSTACTVDPALGLVKMTSGTGTCVISASVTAGDTYGAASTTTQVTITPSKVALTVSASVTSFTYGGILTPRFAITSGALVNSDVLSSVTYKYAGSGTTSYTSQTTAPSNAGTYSVTPSVALGSAGLTSKYDITYAGSIFTIAKAPRTLSFNPAPPASYTLAYGDTVDVDAVPTAGTSDGTITYSSSDTSACSVSSTGLIRAVSSSGSCVVSASISEGTNYFAAATTAQVVVNSSIMPITLKALGASIFFGGSFVENFQLTSGSLATGDTITGVTYTYEGINGTTYGPSTGKPTEAGWYSQTPSNVVLSGNASNYDISYSSNLGTVEIRKVSRTLEFATTSYTLQYGQTQTVVLNPYVGNGTVSYSAGTSTACTVGGETGVITVIHSSGTCEITANISEGTNHLAAATTTPVTVTVAPRNITLTAGSPSVVVGHSFTASQSVTTGTLIGPDTISGVTYIYASTGSTASYGPSATAPTAIGTYSVTPSAAVFLAGSSADYNITYVAGTLNITSKLSRTLAFATTTYSLEYGQTQSAVASPSLGSSDGTVTYSVGSSTACSVDATGLITVTARTGTCEVSATISEGSTYLTSSTTVPVTVTVSTRAITLSIDDLTVAYGGTVSPTHTVASGALAAGDAISGVTYTYAGIGSTTYAASTTAPTATGSYSVTPSVAVFSSGSAANYDITYTPGSLTIGPVLTPSVLITLSAAVGTKVTGSTVSFVASGLSNAASYKVVLRSTPQTIASGSAVAGALSGSATIPTGLEAGWHTVTFTSTGALGIPVEEVFYFKISSSGILMSTTTTMPEDYAAALLVRTGLSVTPYLGAGVVLLLVGSGIVIFGSRRRKTQASSSGKA
jgi:hypothetical protein